MIKFKPISYNEDDFRAFKYMGKTDVLEGTFCKISTSSTRNTLTCTLAKISAFATTTGPTGSGTIAWFVDKGLYFPIYREDPDVENVGATITRNDYVIGLTLRPGTEFEIHKSAMWKNHTTLGSITAIGSYIVLGTSGKLAPTGKHNAAAKNCPIIGVCTGTFNNAWLRVRCI